MKSDKPIKGMRIWKNERNQYTVVETFFYADPLKDPDRLVCTNPECREVTEDLKLLDKACSSCGEGKFYDFGRRWFDKVVKPLPYSQQRQEYFIDFTAKTGKRVYQQFDVVVHVSNHIAPPRATLYRGWDFGAHHPCCVVAYDNTQLDRFETLYCFLGFNIMFRVFCEEVVSWCRRSWPGRRFLEGVDPHGSWSSGHGGTIGHEESETPVKYMQDKYDMEVDWDNCTATDGRDLVSETLMKRPGSPDGVFPFSINKTESSELYVRQPNTKIIGGTQVLIDAMSGQYHYGKKQDGAFSRDPIKNLFSHPMDAMMHAFLRARKMKEESTSEEYVKTLLVHTGREKPGLDDYGGPSF